jgi:hypothetical protein
MDLNLKHPTDSNLMRLPPCKEICLYEIIKPRFRNGYQNKFGRNK